MFKRVELGGYSRRFDPAPPGAGDGTVAPLTEARVTELVGAALKSFENGTFKTFAAGVPTNDSIKAMLTETLAGITPPAVVPPAAVPPGSPTDNAAFKALQKELDNVKRGQAEADKKREAAEKREIETAKDAAVRTALQDLKFVDTEAYNDAYTAVAAKVTRTDDGQFVADNLPVVAFAKDFIPAKKGYLLEQINVGGAGAQRGSAATGGKAGTMEMISSNMSKEDASAVGAAIKNAVLAMNR